MRGRQAGVLEAGQAAFEGAPAACALGIHQGALCIRFLAGPAWRPLPVENPRQVSAYRYPDDLRPALAHLLARRAGGRSAAATSPSSSRAPPASSGTRPCTWATCWRKRAETLRNLPAVVAAANERTTAKFSLAALDCVVYVRHPAEHRVVRDIIEGTLGADAPMARHAVYLEADICRSDLLVEIEAHAVAAGRLRA